MTRIEHAAFVQWPRNAPMIRPNVELCSTLKPAKTSPVASPAPALPPVLKKKNDTCAMALVASVAVGQGVALVDTMVTLVRNPVTVTVPARMSSRITRIRCRPWPASPVSLPVPG